MLNQSKLLVVCDPAERSTASGLLEGLGAQTQYQVWADAVEMSDAAIKKFDAVWLISSGDSNTREAFSVIGAIEEAHLPILASFAGDNDGVGEVPEPGVVTCPLTSPAQVIQAMLASLLSQGSRMKQVRGENHMLHAQQQGVAGQFDKIDEELRMALKIQKEFLPKELHNSDAASFDVLWRPAGYVSGDIYDVIRLDEHHLGLFIADAVGHGVPAALMTIFIKQSLHTKKLTPGIAPGYRLVSPGKAIAGLNRAMIDQDAGAASLGTAAYGVLDTRTNRLTLSKAGHPAPILLQADGKTRWLECDGAMLGVFPDEEFEELVVDLQPGDRLLMYSDGFEVAFPDATKGKLLTDQYTEEFEELRGGEGEHALEKLSERLDISMGSLNQRDDLTVLCTTAGQAQSAAADGSGKTEPVRAVA
jgi:sigma-B regulation protein RsbU (phosphoserine phosphatase)